MSGWSGYKYMRRSDRFDKSKKQFDKHRARTKKDNHGSFPLSKQQLRDHTVLMKHKLEEYSEAEYVTKTKYYSEESDYPVFAVPDDSTPPTLVFERDNIVDYMLKTCCGDDKAKCAILNFASAKNPGGAFGKGSGGMAQEEAICYSTGLYQALIDGDCNEMYFLNRSNDYKCLYRNDVIVSPAVPVFYDGKIQKLSEKTSCNILTCAAVNYKQYMIKSKAKDPHSVALKVMSERIDKLLSIALSHGYTKLVLGPWGCGVFGGNVTDLMNHIKMSSYYNGFEELHFISLSQSEVDNMRNNI